MAVREEKKKKRAPRCYGNPLDMHHLTKETAVCIQCEVSGKLVM